MTVDSSSGSTAVVRGVVRTTTDSSYNPTALLENYDPTADFDPLERMLVAAFQEQQQHAHDDQHPPQQQSATTTVFSVQDLQRLSNDIPPERPETNVMDLLEAWKQLLTADS